MLFTYDVFVGAYKALCSSVSENDAKPILTTIHYIWDGSVLTLESCDSYVATRISIKPYEANEKPFNKCFPATKLTGIKKNSNIMLTFEDSDLIISDFANNRVYIKEHDVDDRYPCLDVVLNATLGEPSVTFNVKKLKRMLSGLDNDDIVTLFIRGVTKPVAVKSEALSKIDTNCIQLISPCKLYNRTYEYNPMKTDGIKESPKAEEKTEEKQEEAKPVETPVETPEEKADEPIANEISSETKVEEEQPADNVMADDCEIDFAYFN